MTSSELLLACLKLWEGASKPFVPLSNVGQIAQTGRVLCLPIAFIPSRYESGLISHLFDSANLQHLRCSQSQHLPAYQLLIELTGPDNVAQRGMIDLLKAKCLAFVQDCQDSMLNPILAEVSLFYRLALYQVSSSAISLEATRSTSQLVRLTQFSRAGDLLVLQFTLLADTRISIMHLQRVQTALRGRDLPTGFPALFREDKFGKEIVCLAECV